MTDQVHQTVKLEISGQVCLVDEDIAKLVERMNGVKGIHTFMSCQGSDLDCADPISPGTFVGRAWISFQANTEADFLRFRESVEDLLFRSKSFCLVKLGREYVPGMVKTEERTSWYNLEIGCENEERRELLKFLGERL